MRNSDSEPLRVLFVISNLSYAGAQLQMLTLLRNLDRSKISPEVCTLSERSELELEITKLGIPLWRTTKRFRYDPWIFVRFAQLCRRRRIQVIYSWLEFDNLVGRVGGRLAGVPCIIASECNTNYTLPGLRKYLEKWTIRLSDVIVTPSLAGRKFLMEDKKVTSDRIRVIHNGFDSGSLKISTPGELRRRFSVPSDAIVIGLAARIRPQKNFDLFFDVGEKLTTASPNVWFLHVGDIAPTYESYGEWVHERQKTLRNAERIILGGLCREMGKFYEAIDILLFTSDYESSPTVLVEGMMTGLPVVSTDVGDNQHVLGDQGGIITAVGDEQALVAGLTKLIEDRELRKRMGEYNRQRATDLFSLRRMISETEQTIIDLYHSKFGLIRNHEMASNSP